MNLELANKLLEQALALARNIKHLEAEAVCELALGEAAFENGDQPRAQVRFTRSLAVCEGAGDKRGHATATWWLGRLDLQRGHLDRAQTRLQEALRAFHAFEMHIEMLSCLEDHADLAGQRGAVSLGVRLAAATSAMRTRLGLARSPRAEQRWNLRKETLTKALADTDNVSLWAEGSEWDLEGAMSSAMAAY